MDYRSPLLFAALSLTACELGGTSNALYKNQLAAQKGSEPVENEADPNSKKPVTAKPIEVCVAQQLADMRSNLAGDYKLICDVNLINRTDWTPIGSEAAPFTGHLDGDGYKIYNLNVTNSARTTDLSLFGVNAGVLENFTVETLTFVSPSNVASIANHNKTTGSIRNVQVEGNAILAGGLAVGGLVGLNEGAISDSSFDGSLLPLMRAPVANATPSQASLFGNLKTALVGGLAGRSVGANAKVVTSLGKMAVHADYVYARSGISIFAQQVALSSAGVTYPVADVDKAPICIKAYDANSVTRITPDPRTLGAMSNCNAEAETPDLPIPTSITRDGGDYLRGGIAADNTGLITNCTSSGKIGHLINR